MVKRKTYPVEATLRAVATYLAVFALFFWIISEGTVAVVASRRPSVPPGLTSKTAYYIGHADDFDLVYLGDSRTYCGVQPEIIDSILGTSSINLSSFAHWFPTQYPQIQDILPSVPAGTTLVWSVGHQNFRPVPNADPWQSYPIGRHNVAQYRRWGFDYDDMKRNVETRAPLNRYLAATVRSLTGLMDTARRMNEGFWFEMERPLGPGERAALESGSVDAAGARRLAAQHERSPEIVSATVITAEKGRPTSIALRTARGSYRRIELDRDFFRSRQVPPPGGSGGDPPGDFVPDPAYWNLFTAALDLFAEQGIPLVVSEMEEAPHTYGSPADREAVRRFMRERVKPLVEERGFGYVRVDFDRLVDDHYFDYNHLNSRGAARFSPMLAEALGAHLSGP